MNTRHRTIAEKHPRAGLAPLELVLWLPIMLFVMALMINFGNMAAWKVRAQQNTRYATWRTLRDRTGQRDPNPLSWPRPATLANSGGEAMTQVNALWNAQPLLLTPALRGPVIADPAMGRRIEVPGRFDMQAEIHGGDGKVTRQIPLLRGILPNDGRYTYNEHQELLDQRWDYRHLNWPRNPFDRHDVPGDAGNNQRRAKRWYRLDPPFFPELQGELQRLAVADGQLKRNPSKFDLDPLDRDPEFYFYYLRRQLGFSGGTIPPVIPDNVRVAVPDFHPRARMLCNIDVPRHQAGSVQPLVQQVQRLPGRMAQAFINLYQSEISRLQQMQPPPQAEIEALQEKLQQVQQFYNALPRQYR